MDQYTAAEDQYVPTNASATAASASAPEMLPATGGSALLLPIAALLFIAGTVVLSALVAVGRSRS